MSKKLTKQELEDLQSLNMEFNKIKGQLGDLSLQEFALCKRIEEIKVEFQINEKNLMDKYGSNSVINLETGEIKEKEEEKE
jgi:hypothetical protein